MEKQNKNFVLDSSAIAILLSTFKEKAISLIKGRITLDLAYYELGNVLWKEAILLKRINKKEARERAKEVGLILSEMEVMRISDPEELVEIMSLALKSKLTFYDSVYLFITRKLNASLVTEDSKLIKKSKEVGVKAMSTQEYIKLFK